jgi:2-polyprenyl-3-methyl-5-hydroxy-6-metoxy-1,4-benzoquinol methylase
MPNFSKRSNQKELLDRDDIPFGDISQNMQELEFINKYLGGHQITLMGLKKFIESTSNLPGELHICEIGCGGGDNLMAIANWCKKQKLEVRFTGIDINKECIQHASVHCKNLNCSWIVSDYRKVQFSTRPHIIFTSLFCHHFTDDELIDQLRWMKEESTYGFFINDLHRHPIAYHSIKLLTQLFSKSYLVKNDAPFVGIKRF